MISSLCGLKAELSKKKFNSINQH